jgi:tRNA threonylcarbamoyl adenosine modification protein YeaZ
MFTLILDTSSEKGIIVIAHNDQVIFESHLLLNAIKGSTLLFSKIEEALAVAQGPGSFTGIRVAASLAKAIAIGASLPLIGFCSLLGFIPDVDEKDGPFASLIDAKIGGAYLMLREKKEKNIYNVSSVSFVPSDNLKTKLLGCHSVIFPSPGRLSIDHGIERAPCGSFLATFVETKFREKDFSLSGEVALSYLR